MTWLVFGVSCLLALAGAVSIISGAPIIQLERGWAEVISGTVALAGGGVVFALATILMRLEAIRDTMAGAMAARVLAEASAGLPVTRGAAVDPEGVKVAAEPAQAIDTVPTTPISPPEAAPLPAEEDGAGQALWKRVKRPSPEQPDAENLREHGFPDRVVPDESPEATTPVVVPAHPVPGPDAIPGPPPANGVSDEPQADAGDGRQLGWLERSFFKGRPARPDEAGTDPRPEAPSVPFTFQRTTERTEPSMAPIQPSVPPDPPIGAPEPSAVAGADATADLSGEQEEGATVIGRYQAGVASYVMYSDGTIEVETEGGESHRFGSMDELKAYIGKQDASVS